MKGKNQKNKKSEKRIEKEDEIIVGIGEYKVAHNPSVLKTLGLGSCVGVALYDPKKRIGGLAHVMLPGRSRKSKSTKYAYDAIELMIDDMISLGAEKKNIIAKMAGGAQIFKFMTLDILKVGNRNIDSIRRKLKEENIKIVAEDIGGNKGRNMFFYTKTGRVLIKYSNGEERWL